MVPQIVGNIATVNGMSTLRGLAITGTNKNLLIVN